MSVLFQAAFCKVIGASLSEPHTGETALRMYVCIYIYTCLRPYTVILNERISIEMFYEDQVGEGLLPEYNIGDPEQRRLKLKNV